MHLTSFASSFRPAGNTSLLLALAAGVLLIPDTMAVAPGNMGSITLRWDSAVQGYPGGVPALSPDAEWRFDGAGSANVYYNGSPRGPINPYLMQVEILQVLDSSNNDVTGNYPQFVMAYCADRSKALNTGSPSLTYEWVPNSSIGYYSDPAGTGGVTPKLDDAKGIAANGIGVEKGKLLQALADRAFLLSLASADASAAYQIAVWKIVAELVGADTPAGINALSWDLDTTASSEYMGIYANYPGVEPAYLSTAQSYLDSALDEYNDDIASPDADVITSLAAVHGTTQFGPLFYEQDLILYTVPEPGTYGLIAGLGLVGFGLYRRLGRQA